MIRTQIRKNIRKTNTMPYDDEMREVANSRVLELAEELEERANRQEERDNDSSEMLRDVAARMKKAYYEHK